MRRGRRDEVCKWSYLPFFAVEHHAPEIVIHGMAIVEAQRVLRDHVELPPEGRECLTIHAMRVTSRVNIRPRLMDLAMDRECSRVDRLVPDHDVTFLVDEDQVRHADLAEVLG